MNSRYTFQTVLIAVMALMASLALASPPDCSKVAGSLPNPSVVAGTPNSQIPIDHTVIIVQENHSFDSYFGRLNQPQFYGSQIDGILDTMTNPGTNSTLVNAHHETNLCLADTNHSWDAEHESWNNGQNDGFGRINGTRSMAYYDQTQIPYYYALANQFAVADRYFCGALTSTFSNRYFLYAGTAFGHISNDFPKGPTQFSQKTVFDEFDQYGVSWKYYTNDVGYLKLFQPMWTRDQAKMGKIADYQNDLKNGTLPQVVFLDATFDGQDEHPAADITYGESWVASIIDPLIQSSSWKTSAIFLTYDENGGFYDHVAPPEACVPDNIPPKLNPSNAAGTYDRYGFRVPFVLISPFAKHHYVSHTTYSHTSILKFLETRFNLPTLSARDANEDAMLDLFDFNNPVYTAPTLPIVVAPVNKCTPTGG